jgi:hypothetical protein
MTSPVSDITTRPIEEWARLEMLLPTSTAAGLMGSDRIRSTMPFSRSAVSPTATMKDAKATVWAMIPGSSQAR